MEKLFKNISFMSASLVLVILIGIFITLFSASKDSMKEYGFGFLTSSAWQTKVFLTPEEIKEKELTSPVKNNEYSLFDDIKPSKIIYGGLIPIVGTIFSTLIAIIFALPIAMGIAVFLAEIAPKNVSAVVGVAIELLAAIPSIIFGMWGLFYFAPVVQSLVGGYQVSLLNAGLVLGVMILPFMAAITRDSMKYYARYLKRVSLCIRCNKIWSS